MKKFLLAIFCFLFTYNLAKADFAEHYNLAQQYLSQYQYSSAITEFKRALRINYLDNSARVGLVNSYLARGTYLGNNDKNWEAAANDYRAALFYLRYYASNQDVQNSLQAISNSTQNLNQCLQMSNFNTSAKSRFEKAQQLRLDGLFAEAGYEFNQALTDASLRRSSYEQIGDIMKTIGNDPKSGEYYKKAIELAPNEAGLRLKYARVLDRLDKCDAAAQEYNFALANGGDDPEILYALERIYRQKLDQAPNDAPTITNLGAILQKQNKFDEALKYYTQASQIDPANVTTRLNVGTLYQQKGSYDAAIGAYDSILLLYPDNIQANLYKAQCLLALGQNDKASQIFNKVVSLDPSNKDTKFQIYDTLKSTMSPDQFIEYLAKNAATDKNTANYLYDYAIDLHKQNNFDAAINGYKQVLKLKTDNPEVYINLAIAYKQKQNYESAKQILQTAKLNFPGNKPILDNLQSLNQEVLSGKFNEASEYYNKGEFQKAMDAYLSIQPPSVDSLSGIAACYKALNDDEHAIEYYKKALDLNPNSDISYYIGVLYSEKEDWNNSKAYLKRAIALNAKNQKAKDLLGSIIEQSNVKFIDDAIALYDKGDYAKAMAIFNKVLIEDPKNGYALYYKAMILDVDKKYSQAIIEYQKAIKYNPDLTIIYYLMALDYDNVGQFKSALQSYKKYVAATSEQNEYKDYAQSRIKALKKYEG